MCRKSCIGCMRCLDEQEMDDWLDSLEKKRAEEEDDAYFTLIEEEKRYLLSTAHF